MTAPDAAPVLNQPCARCGQLDDHPLILTDAPEWISPFDGKRHVAPDFHFDCLPGVFLDLLGTPETHPQHAVTLAAIEKAKSGVRGDKLRKFLQSQPSDNEIGA